MINTLNFKNNDYILDGIELIPLISNIDDVEGVLIEHNELNKKSNKLEFALIEHEGDYYFIDCKKSIREDVYITDGKNYICPNCRQELALISGFTRNGKQVDSYLRHIASDVECDFKTYYNSKEIDKGDDKKYTGEGKTHKYLKLSTQRNIIDHGIMLNIPVSYSIGIVDNKPVVKFEYKEVLLNNADTEKTALKGDDITKGYRPDITAYTNDGETVYIEVTNQSGKTVKEYYDVWKRLNKTVIEVRKVDNVDDDINYEDYIDEYGFDDEGYYEDIIINDKSFRILYDPVVDEARREKLNILKDIADKKKESEQKDYLKKLVNRKLFEINKDAKENKIDKMPVQDIKFEGGKCVYIGFNNFKYPSYWYKIFYEGITIYRTLPVKIYKELKNRCEYLTIVRS